MDIVFAFALTFIMLIICVSNGIFIAYPLLAGLLFFILLAVHKGFSLKDSFIMALRGSRKSLPLISIFLLIGIIIATWMAGGTIAFITYYGTSFLNPNLFILSVFIVSCAVSFMLGTSLGTTGTIGVAFMVMARSGSVNLNLTAGAIIAGAFFGDRCSFMSSSANLVANVTETNLFYNIKNMLKSTVLPFIVSVLIYTFFSFRNPLSVNEQMIGTEILRLYNINPIVLLPALSMLLLALLRINVKFSMLVSILLAAASSIFIQHKQINEILKYSIWGYQMGNGSFLAEIIKGGGALSMLKLSIIVIVSSAYSGIFEGTGILKEVELYIINLSKKYGSFTATLLTSILTASFGCTQTIAVMLTHQLVKKAYAPSDKYVLAEDIENTAIVVSPLIPWNIAGALPAAVLSVGPAFILYSFYLYLLPLIVLIFKIRVMYSKACMLKQ